MTLKKAVLDMDRVQQCQGHMDQEKGSQRHKVKVSENVNDLPWVAITIPSDTHRELKDYHIVQN